MLFPGPGTLTKQGTALLNLNAANTYTGGTTVLEGELRGTPGVDIQGNVVNNADVGFDVTGTFADEMSGTGRLLVTGTAVATLTGSNTFTGGTVVSGASFVDGTTRTIPGDVFLTAAGDTLRFDVNQDFNGTHTGNITGLGNVVRITGGTGNVTLSGTNTYSGGTTLSGGAGGLTGTTSSLQGAITGASAVAITFDQSTDGIYSGNYTGAGAILTKSGTGSVTLTGTGNTYTGVTNINEGTLVGTTSTFSASAVTNNATMTFDQGLTAGFTQVISGSGQVIKDGPGTVTLSGINTYTGGTTINDGGLTGSVVVGAESLVGDFVNNSVLTISSATGTFNGAVSGTGKLVKAGAGVVLMQDTSSYTGGTDVNAGTLTLGTVNSIVGDVFVEAAAVLSN